MDVAIGECLSFKRELSSGCRSSILNERIDFVSFEKEEEPEKKFNICGKYTVLTPDQVNSGSSSTNSTVTSNKWIVKKKNDVDNHIDMKGSIKTKNLVNGYASNNDPIGPQKIVIYPKNKLQLDWKQVNKVGAGLINLGNTCYMNSVLQCLSYCPPLVNHLLYSGEDHSSKCKISSFCMVCEFQQHLQRLYSNTNGAIKPQNIFCRLKSIARHFHPNRQEDAHEFLRYVLDHMWKSYLLNFELSHNSVKLDARSKETTVINEIFGGYHRSQVICSQCKEKSNTYDHFMDFILDIKDVGNLEDAFKKFTQPEVLQNENAYKCPNCKKKVTAIKRSTVFRPPNVVTIQFKRFDYNRIYGGKITKKISYPEVFNMRPFMSEAKGAPISYRLNSILVHLGSTSNSGHYYCYIRSSNGLWYLMDDGRVVQVNLSQVLEQQAYILFYVRYQTQNYFPNNLEKSINNQVSNILTSNNQSKPNGTLANCRSITVFPNGHDKITEPQNRFLNGEPHSYSSSNSSNKFESNSIDERSSTPVNKKHLYDKSDRSKPSTPTITTKLSSYSLVDYDADSSDDSSSSSPVNNGSPKLLNSSNHLNGVSSKKAEKRLMKLKKKNKKKRKRKRYSEELEWVERTKETVEKERRIKHQI